MKCPQSMLEQFSIGSSSLCVADISLQGEEGTTAPDYARENSHEEVVNQLEETN